MKMRAGILAAVLAAFVASAGFAAGTGSAGAGDARHDEKIANIRKLLHVMSGKQMKDMMDKMLQASFRAVEAQMPPEARGDAETKQVLREFMTSSALSEKDLEDMLNLMVPSYDKFLDDADVLALLGFYESPAGRKFVRVMPDMMVEAMPAIMSWQMEKMKGPVEALRKRLEAIEEKREKEKEKEKAAGPRG